MFARSMRSARGGSDRLESILLSARVLLPLWEKVASRHAMTDEGCKRDVSRTAPIPLTRFALDLCARALRSPSPTRGEGRCLRCDSIRRIEHRLAPANATRRAVSPGLPSALRLGAADSVLDSGSGFSLWEAEGENMRARDDTRGVGSVGLGIDTLERFQAAGAHFARDKLAAIPNDRGDLRMSVAAAGCRRRIALVLAV